MFFVPIGDQVIIEKIGLGVKAGQKMANSYEMYVIRLSQLLVWLLLRVRDSGEFQYDLAAGPSGLALLVGLGSLVKWKVISHDGSDMALFDKIPDYA